MIAMFLKQQALYQSLEIQERFIIFKSTFSLEFDSFLMLLNQSYYIGPMRFKLIFNEKMIKHVRNNQRIIQDIHNKWSGILLVLVLE